ncbi:MAG: hypothetical protein JXA68_08650 [Ignavibacteriales bacterium]|nr:hypothetical protein [Ignavibacteriales bacterium]
MKIIKTTHLFFLLLLSFIIDINSQVIGTFQNYSSFNKVKDCIFYNDKIYTATEGGLFILNKIDSTYQIFTKSENLSSQRITSIAIDKSNCIWLGTEEGIVDVFDVSNSFVYHVYDIKNSNYNSKKINNILIIGDTAYISTDFGICLININNRTFIDTYSKLGENFTVGNSVKNIFIDKKVYACHYEGLAVQKTGVINLSSPTSWINYPLGTNIPSQKLNDVIVFQDTIFIATEKGIYKLNASTWEKFGSISTEVFDLFTISNKIYYITETCAYKFENGFHQQIYSVITNMILNKIFINQNNVILISTTAGIVEISGNNSKLLFPNELKTNIIQSLTVDQEDNLWMCSQNDESGYGIFKFDGNKWHSYAPFPLSSGYHKTYSTSKNTIYFCNWGNGFTRFKNGRFHNFTVANTPLQGIPADPNYLVINDIENDNQNNTWILNHNSASNHVLSMLSFDSLWYNFTLGNMVCYHLAVDENGTKWFAELNAGLHYFNDKGTYENTSDDIHDLITTSNGLNSNIINDLVVDKRGELWIGTSLGVNIISNTNSPENSVTYSYPLKNLSINCIAVDAINLKWIGTPQGVFLVSQDGNSVLAQYNTANSSLPSNNIKSITFNENTGIVYIGTDNGIMTITTTSIKPQEDFSELFIFPNPVIVDEKSNININITGLVEESQIKILSIDGKLVNEFASPGGDIAIWNGLDNEGKLVSTGIYLIVAYDKSIDKITTSKVAIIRK